MNDEARTGLRALGASVVWAAPLMALWVALTDNTHTDEMVAGIVSALLAGIVAELAGLMGRVRFQPRLRWLVRAAKFPFWIVQDTWIVLRAMVARTEGSYHRIPFRRPQQQSLATAARALAEGPGTAGPNLYVIEEQGDTLFVHILDSERGSLNPADIVNGDP